MILHFPLLWFPVPQGYDAVVVLTSVSSTGGIFSEYAQFLAREARTDPAESSKSAKLSAGRRTAGS